MKTVTIVLMFTSIGQLYTCPCKKISSEMKVIVESVIGYLCFCLLSVVYIGGADTVCRKVKNVFA